MCTKQDSMENGAHQNQCVSSPSKSTCGINCCHNHQHSLYFQLHKGKKVYTEREREEEGERTQRDLVSLFLFAVELTVVAARRRAWVCAGVDADGAAIRNRGQGVDSPHF